MSVKEKTIFIGMQSQSEHGAAQRYGSSKTHQLELKVR
jgi:hypothetical protein